mmetsp:Transcript_50368/g.110171  ORF Transcript_50368/g.110171 Transcript_50368/m.110171 type:complete len:240 (+) Transcript_50368:47-766(+)
MSSTASVPLVPRSGLESVQAATYDIRRAAQRIRSLVHLPSTTEVAEQLEIGRAAVAEARQRLEAVSADGCTSGFMTKQVSQLSSVVDRSAKELEESWQQYLQAGETAPVDTAQEEDQREGQQRMDALEVAPPEAMDPLRDELIRERDAGIRNIQSEILTVNALYRDMATLVVEQGQSLQTIEGNFMRASDDTEAAVHQLDKTAARSGRCLRLKAAFVVFLLVLLTVLVWWNSEGLFRHQ